MKKNSKKIAFLSVALAATIPLSNVIAEVTPISTETSSAVQQVPAGNSTQVRAGWEARRQEAENIQAEKKQLNERAQTNRQQKMQDRCQRIQAHLSDKVTQVENNKQNFGIAFANMKARLQRLSDRLASKNIDVTKLNQDLATLNTKIDKLTKDHEAFITNLKNSLSSAPQACGTSQGQFISQLESARSSSLTVEQDRLDIKSFYQSTIKADLMAIRSQIEKEKPSSDSSVTSTDKKAQ